MTPEQRAALDALPAKRRVFVLELVGEAKGNATEAARRAGYAAPGAEGCRLLKIAEVAHAVASLRHAEERSAIASVEELRAFWSAVMRGEAVEHGEDDDGFATVGVVTMRDRLKAAELLGKSQGAFVAKVEHSGPGGGPIAVTAVPASREEAEARLAQLQTKLRRIG